MPGLNEERRPADGQLSYLLQCMTLTVSAYDKGALSAQEAMKYIRKYIADGQEVVDGKSSA